jgi:O-antigen/teichoic acid export membrane protein
MSAPIPQQERKLLGRARAGQNGGTIVTSARTIANALLSNDVLKGSAAALAVKFTGSVLGFAMFALAARAMLPHDFGTLAVIFNAMSFLAVIAACGQETLIVRSWDEYSGSGRPGLARGALTFGVKLTVAAGLSVAALAAAFWHVVQPQMPVALIAAACLFLLMQAFMNFSAQFSRVAAGVIVGETPREILWRLVVVLIILGHQFLQSPFTANEFFLSAAAAIALSILIQQLLVARTLPRSVTSATSQYEVA